MFKAIKLATASLVGWLEVVLALSTTSERLAKEAVRVFEKNTLRSLKAWEQDSEEEFLSSRAKVTGAKPSK